MLNWTLPENMTDSSKLFFDSIEYSVDSFQRSVLYHDVLREQGNIFIDHIEKGLPPVLKFDYETIIDGRTLDNPVNYALARILPEPGNEFHPARRPVVIIDPRAGHGPGIGGSKEDSEVGIAMRNRRPVYFVYFFPEPVEGQTLADVKDAEIYFIQEVAKLHPEAAKPAVIGNCQAGWAVAILAADNPDLTGPLILNGSPLSYWAGKEGGNPMRYKGGLIGGTWMSSLWADLGNGTFDGANLVKGFEDLNPANSEWTKKYNLYSKIDTEAGRYLDFERWWNGFFLMTREEIQFITQNLFVGNRLERGRIEFEEGKKIDLKNIQEPIILFASEGDNITPPQQALNWVLKVWGSIEEVKRQQQVIIYLIHKDIGHLGIFVSGKVAKREHKEIIGHVDLIEYLSPGLYEMVIDDTIPGCEAGKDFDPGSIDTTKVNFVPKTFEDILEFDDGLEDETGFVSVLEVSKLNENIYQVFLSPIVKSIVNENIAKFIRTMHPLRLPRYIFSDLNPFLMPVNASAPFVKENRQMVSEDNFFLKSEKIMSNCIEIMFNYFRDETDNNESFRFNSFYGHPLVNFFFGGKTKVFEKRIEDHLQKTQEWDKADKIYWREKMEKGGLPEGVARIMVAMAHIDESFDQKELRAIEKALKQYVKDTGTDEVDAKKIIKEQARILQVDKNQAIEALPKILNTPKLKHLGKKAALYIAEADEKIVKTEKVLIEKINRLLE